MTSIKSLATTHPRVGIMLSPEANSVRGQLYSLGFVPCDGGADVDWLVTDGTMKTATDKPVLQVPTRISVFRLRQAILDLLTGGKG